jgi:hypothetical protein
LAKFYEDNKPEEETGKIDEDENENTEVDD